MLVKFQGCLCFAKPDLPNLKNITEDFMERRKDLLIYERNEYEETENDL